MNPSTIEAIGTAIFAVAVLHTFLTKHFEGLAHRQPAHAGLWHLMGEVEAVFGFWALVVVVAMAMLLGTSEATAYLEGLNFTEPMFVFVIMVVAASKPVLDLAQGVVRLVAKCLPLPAQTGYFLVTLTVVPLLGSFITEPAAMTLAALILRRRYYAQGISRRLKYAALGALFVNVSIGGTLTPYAAPPVLMVAGKWGWDFWFMFGTFGWKAALAVAVNAIAVTAVFARELKAVVPPSAEQDSRRTPLLLVLTHLAFLSGVVVFAHHPVVFMGLFLFFLGVVQAYHHFQDRLFLREGLMVAFFLAGLVTLGGLQKWWLQTVLAGMDPTVLYFGATALTAITDNAALTYLGSLVQGVDDSFKYALVAGAVTGGGLTVIANAPNPAGFAILREHFDEGAISPLLLFAAALPATIVAVVAFQLL